MTSDILGGQAKVTKDEYGKPAVSLKIKDVDDIHHIHIWSIDGFNNYATMHIVTKSKNIKEIRNDNKKTAYDDWGDVELENFDYVSSFIKNEKSVFEGHFTGTCINNPENCAEGVTGSE